MYTVKDIVSGNFTLLNEYDLLKIEDVVSVNTLFKLGERKRITINLGVYDYFFSNGFKNFLKSKIKKDLGELVDVKFSIAF